MEWAVAPGRRRRQHEPRRRRDRRHRPDEPGGQRPRGGDGALFVVAAGNAGGVRHVSAPGAADAALTVGAVDGPTLAGFSSRGPRVGDHALKPDLAAPGRRHPRRARGRQGGPGDGYYTARAARRWRRRTSPGAAILKQPPSDLGWRADQGADRRGPTVPVAGATGFDTGSGPGGASRRRSTPPCWSRPVGGASAGSRSRRRRPRSHAHSLLTYTNTGTSRRHVRPGRSRRRTAPASRLRGSRCRATRSRSRRAVLPRSRSFLDPSGGRHPATRRASSSPMPRRTRAWTCGPRSGLPSSPRCTT